MLETLFLPVVALSSLGWSLISARRGHRPVAIGAAVMALVLGAAAAAQELPVMAWLEGGYGMVVLALTGSYALGSAAAFRASRSAGAKWAALSAAGLTAGLSAFFYFDGLRQMEAVLEHVVDPRDAEMIRQGSKVELLRLIELGGVLIGATVILLGARRGRGASALTPTLSPMGEREQKV